MKLLIKAPPKFEEEKKYIIDVIIREFLGLDYHLEIKERQNYSINFPDGAKLNLCDNFFQGLKTNWFKKESLPKKPLYVWQVPEAIKPSLVKRKIPIIFGFCNNETFAVSSGYCQLPIDIFGSAFFMLTRYEELVEAKYDNHDRFPVEFSLAYQENFLDRPIINEYVEILYSCMKMLCNGLKRRQRSFSITPTHDVDLPLGSLSHVLYRSKFEVIRLIRHTGGDILKRRRLKNGIKSFHMYHKTKSSKFKLNEAGAFDFIMDISEKYNLTSTFFFITDNTAGYIDGTYNIDDPTIQNLLKHIYERGHHIGLHASYNSYNNSKQTQKEFNILRQICDQENIQQNRWGNRQHLLRFKVPITFQNLEDSGLDYDTTLSYAEIPGFRCGTCYEFPVYNLLTRKKLKLYEFPLIVMECSIIDERYMNLGYEDDSLYQTVSKYKENCQLFKGNFILLWHNDKLLEKREREIYENILQ